MMRSRIDWILLPLFLNVARREVQSRDLPASIT